MTGSVVFPLGGEGEDPKYEDTSTPSGCEEDFGAKVSCSFLFYSFLFLFSLLFPIFYKKRFKVSFAKREK